MKKRNSKLARKIIFMMVIIMIVAIGTLTTINIYTTKSSLYNEMKSLGKDFAEQIKYQASMAHLDNTAIQGILENATKIEAARAGDQGKGFGVVAEEIRKLADQSSDSVEGISNLIRHTQEKSKEVLTTIQDNLAQADKGQAMSNKASQSFNERVQAVENTEMIFERLENTAINLTENSNAVVNIVNEVERISQSAASNTQEVAAATQQQAATIEQVNAAIESMNSMTNELNNLTQKFKI